MVRSAFALLALLAGCTTSPLTGREQYMVVSDATAVSQSAAAYGQMMGDLGKKKQIETGTPRAEKVKEITDRLVKQAVLVRRDAASWKWEVQVINDPKTVNAFCMAGGKMAIYTGMWEQLKATDDELAQVMGHEISHALLDHTRARIGCRRADPGRGRRRRQPRRAADAERGDGGDRAAQQPRERSRGGRGRPAARGARGLRPARRG